MAKKKHVKKISLEQADALRNEVNDLLKGLSEGEEAHDKEMHSILREANHSLLEGEGAIKQAEKTLRGSNDPLADKVDEVLQAFIEEEEEE